MTDLSWGALIAERRKKLGLRQSDLAEGLAYSNQAISKIENGETQLPLSLLPGLCRLLKISVNDFLAKKSEAPEVEAPLGKLDNALLANNIAALRQANHLSLAEESRLLGISKGTLILYEKGESLPTLEGLLLLAKQSGKTPEEFLSQSLTDQKPRKENQQSHRILYGVGAGILLVGILVAIIVPLSLRNSAQSSVETTSIPSPSPASESSSEETSSSSASSSEMSSTSSSLTGTSSSSLTSSSSSSPSAFSGLTRYWIKTGDGQDGRAQISAGTTTSLEIMSEPLEYFKNQESTYRFSFTLVNEPTGTTLSDGSDYLSRSLFLPSASKGSSFTITTFVSLLADPSQTFVGDVFSVTVL